MSKVVEVLTAEGVVSFKLLDFQIKWVIICDPWKMPVFGAPKK